VTRIDRAAWRRIKARMAAPTPSGGTIKSVTIDGRDFPVLEASASRTVSFYKGRSVGPTFGILEQMAEMFDVAPQRPGETDEHFKLRCASRWQSLIRDTTGAEAFEQAITAVAEVSESRRFSIENLFKDNDQITRVTGRIQ
jgi:hypothetical protein